MIYGIDCATPMNEDRIDLVKSEGYEFVGRYLVPETPAFKWKALTKKEAELICASGLYIVNIYETTGKEALGGQSAGLYHAEKAVARAKELEVPNDAAIYFTIDYDPAESGLSIIKEFVGGVGAYFYANDVKYGIGVYGNLDVCNTIGARFIWQCAAWSYGKRSPYYDMFQLHSSTLSDHNTVLHVDINEAKSIEEIGAWSYRCKTMAAPAPAPEPAWYESARAWAIAHGITDGTRPEDPATRAEVWTMLQRLKESGGSE